MGESGEATGCKEKGLVLNFTVTFGHEVSAFLHVAGMRTVELERELRGTEQRGEFLKEITIKDLFLVRSVTIMYKDYLSISFK